MPFNDIDTAWEYHKFIEWAKEAKKPYRFSSKDKPRYPLGDRRYSDRFFVPRLESVPEHSEWTNWPVPIEIYYSERYMLGTFHPDDTFEFNPSANHYGQGDIGVLSSVLPGWVSSRVNYGGLVFYHRQTKNVVPVFQGLRIRLCDGTPVQNYEMHVKSLDRKLTKPYRAAHDGMFKTGLTMLRAMGVEGIVKELEDMIKGQVVPCVNYKHDDLDKAFYPNDPAGAVLWLTLRYNIHDVESTFRYQNTWSYKRFMHFATPENIVKNVRKYFYDEIYNAAKVKGEQVLQTKVYKFGDKLPTVEWGHEIIVDGVKCKRI